MQTASMDLLPPWPTAEPLPVSLRGWQLIDEPRLNKSDAMWFPDYVPYVPS